MFRLIRTCAIAACVAALAVPAMAQTKWNLPAAYPADNPHSVNLTGFAKDVADLTGGKLQITVHAAASLFKAPEIKRAVATGQAQAGEVLISLHENEDPLFGIDVSRMHWDMTVGHEAPCNRAEVKGLRRCAVAAAR